MTVSIKTIYERIHYIYSRNGEGFLTLRKQGNAQVREKVLWASIEAASTVVDENLPFRHFSKKVLRGQLAFEKQLTTGVFAGVVTEEFAPSQFDVWFMNTILTNGEIAFPPVNLETQLASLSVTSKSKVSEQVASLFETTIKHCARVDQWSEGRAKFVANVEFFTMRQIPIEAVLPAFPCKSSNIHKVAGTTPDLGEELAILRIIEFVLLVNAIYPPGMQFIIVSDGHVFSDCINVDDDVVDTYTERLQKVYCNVKPAGFDGIQFRGLNDCFNSDTKYLVEPMLHDVEIDHFLGTKLDHTTELNRKILMVGCDDNADNLRRQIGTAGHPRLYLYRGFNKFMSDDLVHYQREKKLSGKKYKRLVSQVAFEMIRRNDAYSNLVELVFPFHLRLSIHAHPNCGPKFGIRLLDPAICAPHDHNQDVEDRLLHIPTPWHNAIYKFEDRAKMIVAASGLALEYDMSSEYSGGWREKEGCFVYTKVNSSG